MSRELSLGSYHPMQPDEPQPQEVDASVGKAMRGGKVSNTALTEEQNPKLQKRINVHSKNDGIFWMSFEDWERMLSRLHISLSSSQNRGGVLWVLYPRQAEC